jgi:hypothetical protein
LHEFTRVNMAPYFRDDVVWQAGVMCLEGIDVFIAANNHAWKTLGIPEVRDVEIDPGDGFCGDQLHPFGDPHVADDGTRGDR